MQRTDPIDRDIACLNAIYLMGLRNLAMQDVRQAAFRYGVSEEVARIVAGYTPDQIQQAAQGVYLVFRPRDARVITSTDISERLAHAIHGDR